MVRVSVAYGGRNVVLDMDGNATVADIKTAIAGTTIYKLIHRGSALDNDAIIATMRPSNDGTVRAMLVGTPAEAIADAALVEAQHKQKQQMQKQIKPATPNTRPPTQDQTQYTCMSLEVLNGFSDSNRALELLDRVRNDWGIKAVMQQRKWQVHTLAELHPSFDASILGVNRNRGERIGLRLRTDALDGFRDFKSIIQVMIHELVHMVHDGHGPEFHALNRELISAVAAVNSGHVLGAVPRMRLDSNASRTRVAQDLNGHRNGNGSGESIGCTREAIDRTGEGSTQGAHNPCNGNTSKRNNSNSNQRPSRKTMLEAAMRRCNKGP